ncbi:MAG: hypothetical protein ABIK31_06660 [candidate division WOR-3 bacterium]
MKIKQNFKKFWNFLKEDSWQSWLVSLILVIILIRFIFFPTLSLITGSSLPLVVVESCSMYHESSYEQWWSNNQILYLSHNITKKQFDKFPFKNGLNKGDIVLVWGHSEVKKGDVIIFKPNEDSFAINPIIHRAISINPISTKGDHNSQQLTRDNNIQRLDETNIPQEKVVGKAIFRVPLLGWVKLIFFEFFRTPEQRGFCR